MHPLFERRMLERECRRPERQLLARLVDRAAIALVAIQRAADCGHLHADLMRPPGVQLDLNQAEPVLAAEQLIIQHSLLGIVLAWFDDGDGIRLRILPEPVTKRCRRLWRFAMHNCDVRLIELPRSDGVREPRSGFGRLGENHDAADGTVKPVDKPKVYITGLVVPELDVRLQRVQQIGIA